jgi:hypothetical protein
MTYASAEDVFASADDRLDEARALLERAGEVAEGSPAWLYLVEHRRLPVDAVRAVLAELRYLQPPLEGRQPQDHALVSLLRDAGGEITGLQLTYLDIKGRPSGQEPRRVTRSLRPGGCRDGLFRAGGGGGDVAYLAEGYCEKPLALASLGRGPTYGGGGMTVLGYAVPPEPTVVIVPDRPPAPTEWTADGKVKLLELHQAAYQDTIDRLILAGKEVLLAATPACPHPGCKDADAFLRQHSAILLADLLRDPKPAKLSDAGWRKRLAGMSPEEFERRRKEFAEELGIRVAGVDAIRKAGRAGSASTADGVADEASRRDRLIAVALDADLFVDEASQAFATTPVEGGVRTYKVAGSGFRAWWLDRYGRRFPVLIEGEQVPGSASATMVADARATVEAVARRAPPRPAFMRLGWADGALYLDLAAPEPAVVEITAEGWRIITRPPVAMVHSPMAQPLPMPEQDDRDEVLKALADLYGLDQADDRFTLLLAVSLGTVMPAGPYPVVVVTGEHGSGKTSLARMLKRTVDPTRATARGRPRSPEDLAIAVSSAWLPVFDNLSKLDQEMSDWLCRLSEGGGLSKRRLYSDDEEVVIEAARLITITAIPDVARSADLIDRSVFLSCDALETKVRDRVLEDRFNRLHPRLLGMLLDAASHALRHLHEQPDSLGTLRRGDFLAWAEAAAPALGLKAGQLTEAYQANQNQAVYLALEADPVARALLTYMEGRQREEMLTSALLAELAPVARRQHGGTLPLSWPSLAHHFSGRLRRLAPSLRRVDIEVEQEQKMTGTVVVLTRIELPPKSNDGAYGANGADSQTSPLGRAREDPESRAQRRAEKSRKERHERHERHESEPSQAGDGRANGADPEAPQPASKDRITGADTRARPVFES